MSRVCSIDFETKSQCDLIACGAYVYAQDPTTEVLMMGWAFDDDEPKVWTPKESFPGVIIDHVRAGGKIRAWNSAFERLVWWYVLSPDFAIPEPTYEQFQCTAARARAHGLPGKLDDCARALDLPQLKQAEGRRLIATYSAPGHREEIPPEDFQLFKDYCAQDVVVERMIGSVLRDLTDHEWAEYVANEKINDRGVPLDIEFAAAALEYAEDVRLDVDDKIAKLTGGYVANARARKTRDEWLADRLTDDHYELLTVYKNGEKKFTFDQRHRGSLLEAGDLHPDVRRFVELVEEAGGATISKYKAMANREVDGRLNGALMFNGAGQTGRFASMGIQLHNMRRDSLDDPDPIIKDVIDGYEIEDVTTTLSQLVRSSIYSPKKKLTWFDFSSIEGRVAPWLADSKAGEDKLDLYRNNVDPYIYNAAKTFGVAMEDVDKDQRQAGKLQELALQFLGGVGALKVMAAGYGLVIPDDQAAIMRDGWRAANPWAKEIGNKLDRAAMAAVREPGEWIKAGRVAYAFDGADWLWCKLPSGRLLAYFQPRLEMVETPWGDERRAITCLWGSSRPKKGEPWPRRPMRDGLWLENITQACAADLLREAILRCEEREIEVVLHVHDEIVAEGKCLKALGEAMLELPAWAKGLPVEGEGGFGTRYGK